MEQIIYRINGIKIDVKKNFKRLKQILKKSNKINDFGWHPVHYILGPLVCQLF